MFPSLHIGLYGLSRFTSAQSGYSLSTFETSLFFLSSCLDHGVCYFDTAPTYGAGNASRLLLELKKLNNNFSICSKIGLDTAANTFYPENLLSDCRSESLAFESSLKRILIHSPPEEYLKTYDLSSLFNSIHNLVGYHVELGVSLASPHHLKYFDSFDLPYKLHLQFNLSWFDLRALPLLSVGHRHILSARSVFGSGFLPLIKSLNSPEDFLSLRFPSSDIRSSWNLQKIYTHAFSEICTFHELCGACPTLDISQLSLLLFTLGLPIDSLVLGPVSLNELNDTLNARDYLLSNTFDKSLLTEKFLSTFY